MQPSKPFSYVPTLRSKLGEQRALARIASDVADRIAPRLVIPPPKDRDPEKGRTLTKDEIIHLTGRRIGQYWPLRVAFLEPRFLFKEFGEAESSEWLPRIFEIARHANANAIPLATLDDMLGARGEGFMKALDRNSETRISVRVSSGEIDKDLAEKVGAAMSRFSLTPEQCAVLLDFADADFSDFEAVAPIAEAALESIQEIGSWKNVIYQGTNYPETNPATEDTTVTVPRNEWLAWRAAFRADTNVSERLVFGDYGADSAKFEFRSGGGGAPIRHYRYCTPDSWLVVRGRTDGTYDEVMSEVSKSIVESGKFAGRDFSSADDFIYGTAYEKEGPGNATTWREINTAHHITQVIADLGKLKGFVIGRHTVREKTRQLSLLAESA